MVNQCYFITQQLVPISPSTTWFDGPNSFVPFAHSLPDEIEKCNGTGGNTQWNMEHRKVETIYCRKSHKVRNVVNRVPSPFSTPNIEHFQSNTVLLRFFYYQKSGQQKSKIWRIWTVLAIGWLMRWELWTFASTHRSTWACAGLRSTYRSIHPCTARHKGFHLFRLCEPEHPCAAQSQPGDMTWTYSSNLGHQYQYRMIQDVKYTLFRRRFLCGLPACDCDSVCRNCRHVPIDSFRCLFRWCARILCVFLNY